MPPTTILDRLLLTDPLIFSTRTPISKVMAAMQDAGASCVLVVDQQQLKGILTERDIVRAVSYQTTLDSMHVEDLMSSQVITLRASEVKSVFQLIQILKQHHIRHLPILDSQDQILGIVTPGSIRQRLRPEYMLRYVKVTEVMTPKVITASPQVSLLEITRRMMLHKVSCVVLTDAADTVPVGIITERDIVQFSSLGLKFEEKQAETVMSTPLSTVKPQDSLWMVHQRMQRLRVRRLVVTHERGHLAGIITQTQVLKMCDPKELHYVMQTMQLVINQQKQELQKLNHQLQVRNTQLSKMVNVDELTQVANRRQFNLRMQQEWRRLLRTQGFLSLILGDIDKFKAFNDTYGHIEGDKCLKRLAQILFDSIRRPHDLVARFGGEEFAIILPDTDAAGAEHMVQTLLHNIRSMAIPSGIGAASGTVSMSFGLVTVIPAVDITIDDLLVAADRQMYLAKGQGGNTYSALAQSEQP